MAARPVDMLAHERKLLRKLKSMPGGWYWREDVQMVQALYSLGIKGLLERRLIETRLVKTGGSGRPRVEVRLKSKALPRVR